MPKIMLHDEAARAALGRGIAKLARAVTGTLGPQGMNVIIDRPIGTPMVSRDGVSVAHEIELEDPFENMGVQVAREVSRQTNEIAGDGTTTATAIAAALVESGLACLARGAGPVALVRGLEKAALEAATMLRSLARPISGAQETLAVATLAAGDPATGKIVAEALGRVGPSGIVTIENGNTVETRLEIAEGLTFDRGYLSHHMVTDIARMEVVLERPLILMTDQKLQTAAEIQAIVALADQQQRPLLIIAEEVSPACIVAMLQRAERGGLPVAAIHPPDYGHWRGAMLEDLAIATGGRVIARDLGGRLDALSRADLGGARQVRVSAGLTTIVEGEGDPEAIDARRRQVAMQHDAAPQNIERDKYQERLSRLSGGAATILVGGATPVEQKRRAQLIEDSVNATRAALAEGVVPGGGTALLHVSRRLDAITEGLAGDERLGVELLQNALAHPFACIARNAGFDPDLVLRRAGGLRFGEGLEGRTGEVVDLFAAGIIDPVLVTRTALRNAVSVAGLVLTTQTLIATKPDRLDPTAGPARGGGMERF